MPSGTKKRKAAKRKKEQEQQQLLGVHPPGSPPSQGNGVREEEEENDKMSHDGRQSESGSDFTSPMEQGSHQCHLEVEDDNDEAQAMGEEKDKTESDSTGMVDIVKEIDSMQNGGKEQPSDPLPPQKTDEDAKEIEDIHVVAAEVKKDEVFPPPSLGPIPPASAEVSISETETVTVEHIQSEEAEDVLVVGEGPPPVKHKQWDAIDTANLVERSVSISEEVEQAGDSIVESRRLAENVAEGPTNGDEERELHLSDLTTEETDQNFKSQHGTKRHEIAGTTELEQRTSWLSCCGLFDVITVSIEKIRNYISTSV